MTDNPNGIREELRTLKRELSKLLNHEATFWRRKKGELYRKQLNRTK